MTLPEAVRSVLSNYATFSGRASRSEYWWWFLAVLIAFVLASAVESLVFALADVEPLSALLGLAVILPNLAVGARRLHDTDRSGWWLLLALVPLVGGLVLIYFFVLRGTPGPNRFGPPPPSR